MKKFVSVLLCIAMLFSLIVVPTVEESAAGTYGLIGKDDVYEGLEE